MADYEEEQDLKGPFGAKINLGNKKTFYNQLY